MTTKTKRTAATKTDELQVAEYSVIGYILYSGRAIQRLPRLNADMFADPRNGNVWEIICSVFAEYGAETMGKHILPVIGQTYPDLDCEYLQSLLVAVQDMTYDSYCEHAALLFHHYRPGEEATEDIIRINSLREAVYTELTGKGDLGYDIGYGPLTNRYFRLDSGGGIVVMTGYPNQGKTDWLRCTLAQLIYRQQKHVVMLSFEEPNKAKLVARFIKLGIDSSKPISPEKADRYIDYLDEHLTFITTNRRRPTVHNIVKLIEQVMVFQPVDYIVIDPYLYIEPENDGDPRETERIKRLLTKLHSWSQKFHIWSFIVAHPRKKTVEEEGESFERLSGHLIAGSSHWLNIAEFVLGVSRVFPDRNGGSDQPSYTMVESMKVRDQDICQRGKMYFCRRPSGRYREIEEGLAKTFTLSSTLSERTEWF